MALFFSLLDINHTFGPCTVRLCHYKAASSSNQLDLIAANAQIKKIRLIRNYCFFAVHIATFTTVTQYSNFIYLCVQSDTTAITDKNTFAIIFSTFTAA